MKFEYSNIEWENWEGSNLPKELYEKKDSTSVWIHGLYLDCGFFNTETLKLESSREGILYPKMPFLKLIPYKEEASEDDKEKEKTKEEVYECPVYKTSQRAGVLSSTGHSTNFILPLMVPSDHPQDYFIRLGTCALC